MDFENLWAQYSTELKGYIIKRVRNIYVAEDILQELGVRVLKNEESIKDINNVKAWLYRIAYNLITDYYRGIKWSDEDINDMIIPAQDGQDNYNQETSKCLLKLTGKLSPKYREAILQCDYFGKRQALVSKSWGLSSSGGKSRIQRARKKLKKMFLNCCDVQFDKAGNIIDLTRKQLSNSDFNTIGC